MEQEEPSSGRPWLLAEHFHASVPPSGFVFSLKAIHVFISSRLDYSHALCVGVDRSSLPPAPSYRAKRCCVSRGEHITPSSLFAPSIHFFFSSSSPILIHTRVPICDADCYCCGIMSRDAESCAKPNAAVFTRRAKR